MLHGGFSEEHFWIPVGNIRMDAIQYSSVMKLSIFTDICYKIRQKVLWLFSSKFSKLTNHERI